jgi:hypothetical protein
MRRSAVLTPHGPRPAQELRCQRDPGTRGFQKQHCFRFLTSHSSYCLYRCLLLGDGRDPRLVQAGRLGPPGRGDRLPRPRAHRPRVCPAGAGERGRAGARRGLSGPLRHTAPDGRHADRPLRQRPDLSEPALSGGVSELPPRAEFITPYTPEQNGIIERFFRSLKRGMRLAAQLPQLRARPARAERLDPLGQGGASPPGAGLPEPARLPGA